jgi:3-oxoacyl-[acyl-carrier-protein] synthase I
MEPLAVTHLTSVNALGLGCAATYAALRERRSGLKPNAFTADPLATWIGRVPGVEDRPIAGPLAYFDCRNNRLAHMALTADEFAPAVASARRRYGAHRVGVFVGTSTGGILETELGYRGRAASDAPLPSNVRIQYQQNIFSVADFTRSFLELQGPAAAVSTACSSSAKAFAHASRYISAGLCDAAVVGGVDSLCYTTLYGFQSLQLLSLEPCRPCDTRRSGISIGEAASFALIERVGQPGGSLDVALLGYGESSDAHHMSSPDPCGVGAKSAMTAALSRASLRPVQVDYIVMHGTATPMNDQVEDLAIHALFGPQCPASSVKGWTGHTLGAAGMMNALAAVCALSQHLLPGTLNTEEVDPQFRSNVLLGNDERPVDRVLVNAFGFGGSNCSLVFGRLSRCCPGGAAPGKRRGAPRDRSGQPSGRCRRSRPCQAPCAVRLLGRRRRHDPHHLLCDRGARLPRFADPISQLGP